MVVEADESDRSFLLLAPVIAVVTTIDREHLDQYSSLEEIQEAFLQFANRVPFYGAVVLCLDEPNVQAILPRVKRPIITYGTSSQADLVISDVKLDGLVERVLAEISRRGSGIFRLPSPPGIHNVRNAAAAAAVALALNVPADLIRAGLAKFSGVGRRFEVKGDVLRCHADRRLRPSSRRKFAPRSKRRAAAATSACWCSFSRIATRARSISGTISALRSIRPTSLC